MTKYNKFQTNSGSINERKSLYFIAILPTPELKKDILEIKEEIKLRFQSGHALKSPAHITLQMPFKRSGADEKKIEAALEVFASSEKCFNVDLNGYGAFPPRVVYINITDPEPVRCLHGRLRDMLVSELDFSNEEIMKEVQPHITVATRDLTRAAFMDMWPEYKKKKFVGKFTVHSIFLMKHNGRSWDIMREFPFGCK